MVLFVLLMLIIYSSAQEKAGIKTPFYDTLRRINKMKQQHEENMKFYDEMYAWRTKRHQEWLDLMGKESEK